MIPAELPFNRYFVGNNCKKHHARLTFLPNTRVAPPAIPTLEFVRNFYGRR
jgi:hypothetical protein